MHTTFARVSEWFETRLTNMTPYRLIGLLVSITVVATAAAATATNKSIEYEPYVRQLYATLAAKHLPHGSLDEAIAFQRLLIGTSTAISIAAHKRIYDMIAALPYDAAAILQHGHRGGNDRNLYSAKALHFILGRFAALRCFVGSLNTDIYRIVEALQRHAIEQLLTAATDDYAAGVRLSELFAGQKRLESKAAAVSVQRIRRSVHNFKAIAARRGIRSDTCVALVRLAAAEVSDAQKQRDIVSAASAVAKMSDVEAVLQHLEKRANRLTKDLYPFKL